MAESFLQHRAIQAGGARPQRDGEGREGGGGGGGGDGGEAKEQRIYNLILMRNAQASVS